MENSKLWQGIKRAYLRYDRMMEKQGFYVVLGVCVLVIVLSAFYTFRLRDEIAEAPAAEEEAQSAGGAQNAQTLAEAQSLIVSEIGALAVPTDAPVLFVQPVSGFVDRMYSDSEPQFFSQSNFWRVHTGIDIQADYGALVTASRTGTVFQVWEDNQMGLCVAIDHDNGYRSLYAGLSRADYVRPGDPVAQGQTVGHVGNGVLFESDALPHLHFEIHQNGQPVDPMAVFLGLDS